MADIHRGTNKFYIGEDEQQPMAELTFKPQNEKVIIADHTYVSEERRGEGIAGQLFQALIAYARENDLKIVPECPYIKNKMEATSKYDDVLAE